MSSEYDAGGHVCSSDGRSAVCVLQVNDKSSSCSGKVAVGSVFESTLNCSPRIRVVSFVQSDDPKSEHAYSLHSCRRFAYLRKTRFRTIVLSCSVFLITRARTAGGVISALSAGLPYCTSSSIISIRLLPSSAPRAHLATRESCCTSVLSTLSLFVDVSDSGHRTY